MERGPEEHHRGLGQACMLVLCNSFQIHIKKGVSFVSNNNDVLQLELDVKQRSNLQYLFNVSFGNMRGQLSIQKNAFYILYASFVSSV